MSTISNFSAKNNDICETNISGAFIEKWLIDYINVENARLISHESEIISHGNGFMALVIR